MELKELQSAQADLIDVPVLFDADGEPTDGFKVVGMNSKQYQDADRQWNVKAYKKSARRGGRGIDASTDTGASELADTIEKRQAHIASACIVGIYGFTTDGKPAELNEKTLTDIFTARPTWRTKVLMAIEAEQVFTRA